MAEAHTHTDIHPNGLPMDKDKTEPTVEPLAETFSRRGVRSIAPASRRLLYRRRDSAIELQPIFVPAVPHGSETKDTRGYKA